MLTFAVILLLLVLAVDLASVPVGMELRELRRRQRAGRIEFLEMQLGLDDASLERRWRADRRERLQRMRARLLAPVREFVGDEFVAHFERKRAREARRLVLRTNSWAVASSATTVVPLNYGQVVSMAPGAVWAVEDPRDVQPLSAAELYGHRSAELEVMRTMAARGLRAGEMAGQAEAHKLDEFLAAFGEKAAS